VASESTIFEMNFDDLSKISDAWAGIGGADAPNSIALADDPDGRRTSAKTEECMAAGDAYSKDTFDCSPDDPCYVSFWAKGNVWQGFSVEYPGAMTWTATPDDFLGQHFAIKKSSEWSHVQYVFPSMRIDSAGSGQLLDKHVHGGGVISDRPVRFMVYASSASSSGRGVLCDDTWFDDIVISKDGYSPRMAQYLGTVACYLSFSRNDAMQLQMLVSVFCFCRPPSLLSLLSLSPPFPPPFSLRPSSLLLSPYQLRAEWPGGPDLPR
jgi:hypothetical protein